MEQKIVQAGVGILVYRKGRILLIKRNGPHGEGTWSPPGGHIDWGKSPKDWGKSPKDWGKSPKDWGKSPEDAAVRECLEETSVGCRNIRFKGYTNDYFKDADRHYITLWFQGDWEAGEPVPLAPKEVLETGWYSPLEIPEPRFLPFKHFLDLNSL